MHLLLFSNSKNSDTPYLFHVVEPLRAALKKSAKKAAFVPFAGTMISWPDYLQKVREGFRDLPLEIESVADAQNPAKLIAEADVIFVGGGNTFRLLYELRVRKLLPMIHDAVKKNAALFVGWSAGSNIATPTICTTNDMPIIDPRGFEALHFVPFQINPHYTNFVMPNFQGETRDQRIAEFLALNADQKVIGLPEGDWIEVKNNAAKLHGPHDAVVFQSKSAPQVLRSGAVIADAFGGSIKKQLTA